MPLIDWKIGVTKLKHCLHLQSPSHKQHILLLYAENHINIHISCKKYLTWTHILHPLMKSLPNIFYQYWWNLLCDNESGLYLLPIREPALWVPILKYYFPTHYESSKAMKAPCVAIMRNQWDVVFVKTFVMETKPKIVRQKESKLIQKCKNINEKLTKQARRTITEEREKSTSSWLSVLLSLFNLVFWQSLNNNNAIKDFFYSVTSQKGFWCGCVIATNIVQQQWHFIINKIFCEPLGPLIQFYFSSTVIIN